MTTLDFFVERPGHVVAQVVEAELVVGSVGDVAEVVLALLRGALAEPGDHETDTETEPAVNPTHPFRVATGQIVVHCDEMDALARQPVQVGGQGRDEGLAFTRFHFSDPAKVQSSTTHQLNVVVALAEHTPRRLSRDGESLDEEVVERLTALDARAEFSGLGPQRLVGEGRHGRLEGVHVGNQALESLHFLAFAGSEDSIKDAHAGADAIGRGSLRPPSKPPFRPLPHEERAAPHAALHPSSSRRR